MISTHDKNQLAGSIDKLMHYLAVHVKQKTRITVSHEDGSHLVYDRTFLPAAKIAISPTLYTRLDNCHGAGNCCRVPFDLIYTEFDRQRVVDYDHDAARSQFGERSAEGFASMRKDLLESLVRLEVDIQFDDMQVGDVFAIDTHLYVQRNAEKFWMSKQKSCPYLVMGDDRYFCGVHPFKPLHCWYPHMVVRVMEAGEGLPPKSISLGRMQYGRNHNFGCPVLFTESASKSSNSGEGIFDAPGNDGPYYFDQQFQDDVDKLKWTSDSAASMGFTEEDNLAVGLHERLMEKRGEISRCLSAESHRSLTLWTP